jgi:iron complex outermembrane receptor protein
MDVEIETIESRSLGDHDRSRASMALIPNLTVGDLTLSAGGSAEFFSSDTTRFLPAAGAEWEFTQDQILFISYSEALRQPSYTELNYESPDSLGNTGLERQHTRTTELGYKGEKESGRWSLTLFYERATETVDWVKNAPDSRWNAVNLEEIESFGAEVLGAVNIDRETEISGSALILEKDISGDYYAGRYALDYPQFSGDITLRRQITEDLMVRITQIISKYESNPVREGGEWLTDSSLDLQWILPFSGQLALNAGIRNIFDDQFQFYPGQDSIGRSVYSSLTYAW